MTKYYTEVTELLHLSPTLDFVSFIALTNIMIIY